MSVAIETPEAMALAAYPGGNSKNGAKDSSGFDLVVGSVRTAFRNGARAAYESLGAALLMDAEAEENAAKKAATQGDGSRHLDRAAALREFGAKLGGSAPGRSP